MAGIEREDRIDAAICDGLASLEAPEPSPDFDAGVLRRIGAEPWRSTAWRCVRPAFVSSLVTLLCTLALIQWALRSPLPQRLGVPASAGWAIGAAELDANSEGARWGIFAALGGWGRARNRERVVSPSRAPRNDVPAEGPRSQADIVERGRT